MKNEDFETLYRSKKTGKTFTSKEELVASDAEYDKAHKAEIERAEIRKADAAKVEAARTNWQKVVKDCEKQIADAKRNYWDELSKFNKKYGSYHYSITSDDLADVFSWLWNF